MDRRQKFILLVVVFVLLAIVGVPARATEKLMDSGFESPSGESSHAVAQSDELVQAVKDRAVQFGSGVEGLSTLWDALTAIDVDGSDQDVDASALAALHGETSTAGGVAHAFALVANEMGFACAEEAGDDGRPMVDVTIGEEHFLLDVASGEAGARPWEAGSSGSDEGASPEIVDLPEEEALARSQVLDKEEKESDESEPSKKSADKSSSTIGDTACAQANSDNLTAQSSAPSVVYGVHCQIYGDQANVKDGKVAGTIGESKRLEAIWITVAGGSVSGGIQYQVHVQGIGWQDWRSDGKKAGTSGQSKRLEAIKINLMGEMSNKYDVYYRVHAQCAGWMRWAKNGQEAGTSGMSFRMEAIQIVLVEKGASAPSAVDGVYSVAPTAFITNPGVSYCAHAQTYGWQEWVSNGQSAGTVGQSKRLEALRAKIGDTDLGGEIQYRTHVQTYGWQEWVTGDASAGTSGESKRLEAISIRLTGDMASYFDVWYRVHAQTYGWLGWTKNGSNAGSEGMSKRLEAVQVMILPKGSAAPGSTANPFRKPAKRIIMVGDSRTVGAYWAVNDTSYINGSDIEVRDNSGTWWIARVGAGYTWFRDTAVNRVDSHVTSDSAVVIWMGVNDITIRIWSNYQALNHVESSYASLINAKAKNWVGRGAQVYYATVGPLGYNASDGALREDGHVASNADVQNWNKTLTSQLSSDVQVLDAYGALVGNYSTLEGLHYTNTTSLRYYQFVRDSVL